MAVEKRIAGIEVRLVDDYFDWKHWWSTRWTICSGFFSAMTAAAAAHAPWWFVAGCSGAAFLCSTAAGGSRVISQTPKDGDTQLDSPPEET